MGSPAFNGAKVILCDCGMGSRTVRPLANSAPGETPSGFTIMATLSLRWTWTNRGFTGATRGLSTQSAPYSRRLVVGGSLPAVATALAAWAALSIAALWRTRAGRLLTMGEGRDGSSPSAAGQLEPRGDLVVLLLFF